MILIYISIVYADKMRIAVLDLKAQTGVEQSTANAVSDLIRGKLVKLNRYIIIERSQMAAILEEQGFQQSGCTETDCAVEVGQLLSANYILIRILLIRQEPDEARTLKLRFV